MDSQPLNIPLQTEINRNLAKFYKVHYFNFFPTWKEPPVSGKFYSKHEGEDPIEMYEEMLQKQLARFKSMNRSVAETSNQEYGINREPILKIDRNDKRFYFGRVGCEMTKIEAIIRQARGEIAD